MEKSVLSMTDEELDIEIQRALKVVNNFTSIEADEQGHRDLDDAIGDKNMRMKIKELNNKKD